MRERAKRQRIGIIVDHPARDLDGCVLLADWLARKGFDVFLMPFYTASFDIGVVRPHLLVVNYARPANHQFLLHCLRLGVRLAVLDTEGGLLPKDGPTSAQGISAFLRQSGLDRQLSLYMFWGEELRDAVATQTALPPSKAAVTGCPRFDLALWPKQPEGERSGHVLVNTNFAVVNPARASAATDRKSMRDVGFSETEVDELVKVIDGVMRGFVQAIADLAEARPETEFVLRPHPFEKIEPYQERLASLGNVTVERKGSVVDALAGASCMLHVNCSTAVEAPLSGVPAISLDYANDPRMLELAALPSAISHRAGSKTEALALIDTAHTLDAGEHAARIEPYFGPLDGKATERCGEAILTVMKNEAGSVRTGAKPRKPVLSDWAGRIIGSRTIEQARQRRNPSRAIKFFDIGSVRALQARIAKMNNAEETACAPTRTALGLPSLALRVFIS